MNTKSKLLLTASAATIVLLLVLSVFKIMHIKETSSEIDKIYVTIQQNKDRLSQLEALNSYQPELEDGYKKLIEQIPAIPDEQRVIALLDQYSKENNVVLLKFNFGEVTENDNLNELSLEVSFSGEYSSILKVLEKMENGERLFRINDIQLNGIENESKKIRADISAVVFYNKQ